MSILLVLIPLSILFATVFLLAFIWAIRSGQYEDTCTPSMRLLAEEASSKKAGNKIGRDNNRSSGRTEDNGKSTHAHTMAISEKPGANEPGSMGPL